MYRSTSHKYNVIPYSRSKRSRSLPPVPKRPYRVYDAFEVRRAQRKNFSTRRILYSAVDRRSRLRTPQNHRYRYGPSSFMPSNPNFPKMFEHMKPHRNKYVNQLHPVQKRREQKAVNS